MSFSSWPKLNMVAIFSSVLGLYAGLQRQSGSSNFGLTKIRQWSLKFATTSKGFALYLIILSQHGFHLAIRARERSSPSNFCRLSLLKRPKRLTNQKSDEIFIIRTQTSCKFETYVLSYLETRIGPDVRVGACF